MRKNRTIMIVESRNQLHNIQRFGIGVKKHLSNRKGYKKEMAGKPETDKDR